MLGLLKLLNPYHWYIALARLGARLLLILAGVAIAAFIVFSAGSVGIGGIGMDMLRSLFGV